MANTTAEGLRSYRLSNLSNPNFSTQIEIAFAKLDYIGETRCKSNLEENLQ